MIQKANHFSQNCKIYKAYLRVICKVQNENYFPFLSQNNETFFNQKGMQQKDESNDLMKLNLQDMIKKFSSESNEEDQTKQKTEVLIQLESQFNAQQKYKNLSSLSIPINNFEEINKEQVQKLDTIQTETNQNNSKQENTTTIQKKQKLRERIFTLNLFESASTFSDEGYFKQDKESNIEEQYNRVKADITQYKSYFIKFRWKYLFEFSFYHFLFFVVCGPLSVFIIKLFGKSLPNNLIFTLRSQPQFYQIVFFVFTFCAYTFYYVFDCPNIYFQSEVMLEIAVILIRCISIAIKYATFDPVKIRVIKNENLTLKEIFSDFYLVDWANQTDKIIHNETYFGLRVYDIDPSMFFLEFIGETDSETLKNASQYLADLEVYHTSSKNQFVPENNTITVPGQVSIYGYSIMKEFSIQFKKENEFIFKYAYYFSQGFAIYKATLPIIFRFIEGKYPQNYYWYEYIIMFGVAWNTRQIYFYTVLQLIYGFLDIKRKLFQQEQLAFMIAPRKIRNIDHFKIFPTINIFKISTLKAWQYVRQVCLEYGRSYYVRVQAVFGLLFIVMLIFITMLGLAIFKITKLEVCFITIIISDTSFLFIIILMLCYYCCKVNQSFLVHENILKGNKSIISDIYRNRHKYFSDSLKSQNFIYNVGIQKIKQETIYFYQQDPSLYTLELLRDYDDQIEDLQYDFQNNPIKILGIKITFGLIQSVTITLFSILVTFVASFLKQRTKD
ncbi:transmembrane protein, putative (macronuclear) [Tetrahymena thermophila SB210]|uniref:Transmembrane protein, putative n=1 Tax=Tetrahymena thermophila (strain SB210) TaxID=312017 RepID=I7MIA2_TETTS|nr:transmembrane protein, putative [Tetrahymena thermophila SB210]EAS04223.2 transmembrane protein, putative [Tetrahymena thermophila SB210]|eukprot:XP_001024468.2 transmembrane protein, putative [Tetrahymena thermophila SB210]